MPEFHITRELTVGRGRYVGRVDGTDGEAELTISRRSPTRVIADHTFAPSNMRGSGVAKALVERLVADARQDGFKIVPRCSYVAALFAKHPAWADVLQADGLQD